MGVVQKVPSPHTHTNTHTTHTKFAPVTLWLLVSTFLPHVCKISRSYLLPVPNHLIWTKSTPQKMVFMVKFLWNWGYHNFFHRNARVTKLWSHDQIYNIIWVTFLVAPILLVAPWRETMTCNLHFEIPILRRPRVANFSEIIKFQLCLLKQPLKTQKLEIYENAIYIFISWYDKS